MEILIIILLSLVLVVGVVLLVLLLKRKGNNQSSENEKLIEKSVENVMQKQMTEINKALGENNTQSVKNLAEFQGKTQEFLTQRIESLNKQLDDKIAQLDKKVDEKLQKGFEGTSESMAQVRERLQAINESQKQMESLGKEVTSLRGILEGNQTRGQYGEFQLRMVLNNVFGETPGCFEEQYTMKKVKDGDDVRADAVVFMPEPNKMIAIDSKFPFQDYKRLFDAETPEEKETLKKEFDEKYANGDKNYESYTIETEFWYNHEECDSEEEEQLWEDMCEESNFMGPIFWARNDIPNRNMRSFEEVMLHDGDDDSWNEYPFNTPELDGICIHYFMHDIFSHNHTYSLEDLMQMKPENFSWQVNICLEHWGKSVNHKE